MIRKNRGQASLEALMLSALSLALCLVLLKALAMANLKALADTSTASWMAQECTANFDALTVMGTASIQVKAYCMPSNQHEASAVYNLREVRAPTVQGFQRIEIRQGFELQVNTYESYGP